MQIGEIIHYKFKEKQMPMKGKYSKMVQTCITKFQKQKESKERQEDK